MFKKVLKELLIFLGLFVVLLIVSAAILPGMIGEKASQIVLLVGSVLILIRPFKKFFKYVIKSSKERQERYRAANAEKLETWKKEAEAEKAQRKILKEKKEKEAANQTLIKKDLPKYWESRFNQWKIDNPTLWEDYKAALRLNLNLEESELAGFNYEQDFKHGLDFFCRALLEEFKGNFLNRNLDAWYLKAVGLMERVNKYSKGAFQELEDLIREEQAAHVYRSQSFWDGLRLVAPVLKENPGIKQTETYKKLKGRMDKDDVGFVLYYAAMKGLVKREKSGRTYTLSMVDEDYVQPELESIEDRDFSHLYKYMG